MRDFDHADARTLAKHRFLKVDTSATLNASRAAVWDTISDHTTWPSWHDDYETNEALTDQARGLGATFASREWWKIRSESEVTRWDEGQAIGLTLRRGTVWRWLIRSYYIEIEIEPDGGDTGNSEVHYRAAFTGTVGFWLLSAYSLAHALIGMHWTAKSSLKKLGVLASAGEHPSGS